MSNHEDKNEVIKVDISNEEFTRNVVHNVLCDEDVDDLISHVPHLVLFVILVCHKVWDELDKYSRMKTVAETLESMTKTEE